MNRPLIAAFVLGVLATACQGTSVTSPSSMNEVTAQPSAASQTESTPSSPSESLTQTVSARPSPSQTVSARPSPSQVGEPRLPDGWTSVLTVGGDESTRTVGAQIAHGSAGFLAMTGRWTSDGLSPGPGSVEYSVWHSPNGLEWSERDYPSEFANLSVVALVSAADESYILYGVRGTAGYEAVALRSRDGMTWEQIDTGLPEVIYVQAIERGPAGYLLVGGQGADTNPTLWLSEDGLAWELVHEFDQTEQWVQIHDADGGEEGTSCSDGESNRTTPIDGSRSRRPMGGRGSAGISLSAPTTRPMCLRRACRAWGRTGSPRSVSPMRRRPSGSRRTARLVRGRLRRRACEYVHGGVS